VIDPQLVELKFLDRVLAKLRVLMSRRPVCLVDRVGDTVIVHAAFLPGHADAFLDYLVAQIKDAARAGVEAEKARNAQAE
jgi:hypothetical protein